MTSDVEAWIDGYVKAWQSNDADDIRALFTEDAEYATEPWTTPARGHPAIVNQWLERKDAPGSFEFEWEPLVIAGDLAIATGVTRYVRGTVYSNLWVIRFASDGRAARFTEWWMDQADPS